MKVAQILSWLDRTPFEAFVIELSSGKRIRVKHPENVAILPNRSNVSSFVVYELQGETSRDHQFEPDAVVRLSRSRRTHP